jgi:hypothetical protein
VYKIQLANDVVSVWHVGAAAASKDNAYVAVHPVVPYEIQIPLLLPSCGQIDGLVPATKIPAAAPAWVDDHYKPWAVQTPVAVVNLYPLAHPKHEVPVEQVLQFKVAEQAVHVVETK